MEINKAKHCYMNETLTNFIKTSPEKFWRYISGPNSGIQFLTSEKKKSLSRTALKWLASSLNISNKFITWDDGSTPQTLHSIKPCISEPTIRQDGILNLLLKLDKKKMPWP